MRLTLPRNKMLKPRDKLAQLHAASRAYGFQLENIEPPNACLVLAHK